MTISRTARAPLAVLALALAGCPSTPPPSSTASPTASHSPAASPAPPAASTPASAPSETKKSDTTGAAKADAPSSPAEPPAKNDAGVTFTILADRETVRATRADGTVAWDVNVIRETGANDPKFHAHDSRVPKGAKKLGSVRFEAQRNLVVVSYGVGDFWRFFAGLDPATGKIVGGGND